MTLIEFQRIGKLLIEVIAFFILFNAAVDNVKDAYHVYITHDSKWIMAVRIFYALFFLAGSCSTIYFMI